MMTDILKDKDKEVINDLKNLPAIVVAIICVITIEQNTFLKPVEEKCQWWI